MTDVLAIVPCRGGSVGLKRKNLLPIDGVPMFLRSARAARDAGCDVVVSTDDPEIRSTAIVAGFPVHDRGPELADCVVDEVVKAAAAGWDGPVLLVQPTVQPITADIIAEMLTGVEGGHLSPRSMVEEQTHQIWYNDAWIMSRVNRQDREDPTWREVGIRWWPTVDMIGDELKPWASTKITNLSDIDTAADYRSVTVPKRVALWPLADQTHGMGHLRRCLAIAERLQHHYISFVRNDMDDNAISLVKDRGWFAEWHDAINQDLWILDRLDNPERIPGVTLALEDQHPYATVTINALYGSGMYSGSRWCVLRPEFLAGDYTPSSDVLYTPRLLVMFGGTDPSGLGERVAGLFPNHQVDWIRAGDDRAVAEAMHQADILITSAGRTVFEAAAVGIPTVVLAQNLRETTHTHLGYEHGNIYLGLGRMVSDSEICDTVTTLGQDPGLRAELSARGRPDGKGLDRIIHEVEGLLEGL